MAVETTVAAQKIKQLEQLNCRSYFEEWERLDTELNGLMTSRIDADFRLSGYKTEMEEAAYFATQVVEGKNEAERKTHKQHALQTNDPYQQSLLIVREAEMALATIDADIERVKRRIKFLEWRIRYQSEVIAYLA